MNKKHIAKFLGLPTAILAVSTASILIKLSNANGITIAFYRTFIASIFLIALIPYKKIEINRLIRKDYLNIILSGLFLGLHFGFWVTSLKFTTVASSVVLVTSHPLLVTYYTKKHTETKFDKKIYIAILTAIIGISIMTLPEIRMSKTKIIGDLLAILGMISMAGYLINGRRTRKRVSARTYITLVYLVASITLFIFSLKLGNIFKVFPIKEYFIFIGLALIPTLIGHSIYNWSLGYLKPDLVSLSLLGEPIVASLLAMIILLEIPTKYTITGGIITLIGIYLSLKYR
ncbi:MAG: Permease of the drug/metabolite transporter, DMT superfamily [Candidatus Methanohalarchaeum thermophilum]|uniref:Permease of the drug/metabolite transporter, DMT superfamily n=1 Tax=Methanohalarchaeum thermophilum TaxID=1903181 RepID=A0A1Q6DXD9_METT1|nr:MAG: Permease of the drug/metabolite transporter, DMT superfamily [Candidatus Methanohalarchaeum thermophilum]